MKKTIPKILLVFFLYLIFIYVVAIEKIPDNIVLFENEKLNVKTIFGISIKNLDAIEAGSLNSKPVSEISSGKYEVSLFDNFFVKTVDVDVIENTTVIPVGDMAGLKLYTSGVLVVGMSEIEGMDKVKYKPYENSGIEEGDRIIEINDVHIYSTEELTKAVNESSGKDVKVTYVQDEKTLECSITPVETENEKYKLGLWVRDSAAGVGTVTYYEPETKTFGALGHGISDIDTEELIQIASGEFVSTSILNIQKGQVGMPGKIEGYIEETEEIGEIYKNTEFGIFGTVSDLSNLDIDINKEMEVVLREEIEIGKAVILCDLDNGTVKEYEIEIEEIYLNNNYDNKSMKIKITDQELLDKTGGIIQGMSGSPIIQNGKFIGAVTHVLYSNPEEGYAVFGDLMIKQSKKVSQ